VSGLHLTVVPLGTGAGRPTSRRNVSALALVRGGELLLFDCGEATQHQARHAGLRLGHVGAVFLTHLHGDHVNGLPGLIGSLTLSGREAPLRVVGPAGVASWLKLLGELRVVWPGFPLEVVELSGAGGIALETPEYTVEARALDHRVPAYGFALQEKPRPGTLDVEKLRALGVPPGPAYREYKERGEFVGPPRPGLRIAYVLDTRPCDGGVELGRGADLLVHEGTYAQGREDDARERGHSTVVEAAEVASRAGARRLLLTHLSPTCPEPAELLDQVKPIFSNSEIAEDLAPLELAASP
jgi:ribonuclease Z